MQQRIEDCRCKCNTKFTAEELTQLFESFNAQPSHEAQNLYLRGCVSVAPSTSIRRRPRNEDAKERASYSYSVTLSTRTFNVCKAAFLSIHGIKESRLKKKVLNFDVEITDGRGKHNNHPQTDNDIKDKIREHIGKFNARESHYSRMKNEKKK